MKYRSKGTGASANRGLSNVLAPRTFYDLRRLVQRHTALDARGLLRAIDDDVTQQGWRRVSKYRSPLLQSFFQLAAEILNEISTAVNEMTLTEMAHNCVVGQWKFKFPIEDLVLDQIHMRHPGKRIVVIDKKRALVRDGLGVRLENANDYAQTGVTVRGKQELLGIPLINLNPSLWDKCVEIPK